MNKHNNQETEALTTEELKAIKDMGITVYFDDKQAEKEAKILQEFKY